MVTDEDRIRRVLVRTGVFSLGGAVVGGVLGLARAPAGRAVHWAGAVGTNTFVASAMCFALREGLDQTAATPAPLRAREDDRRLSAAAGGLAGFSVGLAFGALKRRSLRAALTGSATTAVAFAAAGYGVHVASEVLDRRRAARGEVV